VIEKRYEFTRLSDFQYFHNNDNLNLNPKYFSKFELPVEYKYFFSNKNSFKQNTNTVINIDENGNQIKSIKKKFYLVSRIKNINDGKFNIIKSKKSYKNH
jgi:hypothetical protein